MKSNHPHNKGHGNTSDDSSQLESSFKEIYGTILRKNDLTRSELKFLHRVIQRKLRDGTLYLEKEDLLFRPYRHLFYM